MKVQNTFYPDFISKTVDLLLNQLIYNQKMTKLLIFDALTLLICEKNVKITHFCGVKLLAWKSGCVKFLTNSMSALSLQKIMRMLMMKTKTIIMLSQPNDDAVSIRPFLYDHRPHSSGHPGADRHTHIFHMSSIMIIIMIVVIILSLFIIIYSTCLQSW